MNLADFFGDFFASDFDLGSHFALGSVFGELERNPRREKEFFARGSGFTGGSYRGSGPVYRLSVARSGDPPAECGRGDPVVHEIEPDGPALTQPWPLAHVSGLEMVEGQIGRARISDLPIASPMNKLITNCSIYSG